MTAQSLTLPAEANPPAVETPKSRRDQKIMPASLEGQTFGKYRILEPLGRGGMAQVYRAYHPQLDRYVAVKVLRSDLVEEVEFLARFRREAQSVANLRHPNIVQVYDFDMAFDYYFMVMELLEGDTLKVRLNEYRARGQRMPLAEMMRVILDILEGLAYAHSEGIIHRDIKPANVLLTKRGQAVVTDFGIAQIVGGTQYTVSGALMGTLAYMAPEQGLQGTTSVQSDIYSLGIVLYEMLTGHPPFDADTPLAILMKHVNDPLPLPRSLDETVPEELERIVLKALSKDPADRYQNAGEMIRALQEAASQLETPLPERISDPDFTVVGQPAGVAVLSGADRERVTDVPLVSDETDIDIQMNSATSMDAALPSTNVATNTKPETPAPFFATERAKLAAPKGSLRRGFKAAFPAVLALIGYNLIAVMVASLADHWRIFEAGWPVEVLLIGLAFCLAMAEVKAPILMVPSGLLVGTGALMSFYAVTGLWELWAGLWPLQVFVVLFSVGGAFWLGARGDEKEALTARAANLLTRFTFITIAIVVGLAALPFG
jgi:serine/threonine protein kinase